MNAIGRFGDVLLKPALGVPHFSCPKGGIAHVDFGALKLAGITGMVSDKTKKLTGACKMRECEHLCNKVVIWDSRAAT